MPLEVGIKAKDAVARQVNKLLAERVQALLSYDKDQGPLVRWVEKPGKPEPKQRQVANQQSSQPKQAGKPREKVVAGPQFQKEVKLNKRQKLEEALKGGQAAKNHEWQECHRSRDNLTAKCKSVACTFSRLTNLPTLKKKSRTHVGVWIAGPPKADFTLLTNPATVGWRGFVWGAGLRKT